jgi:hypothetical protein
MKERQRSYSNERPMYYRSISSPFVILLCAAILALFWTHTHCSIRLAQPVPEEAVALTFERESGRQLWTEGIIMSKKLGLLLLALEAMLLASCWPFESYPRQETTTTTTTTCPAGTQLQSDGMCR